MSASEGMDSAHHSTKSDERLAAYFLSIADYFLSTAECFLSIADYFLSIAQCLFLSN